MVAVTQTVSNGLICKLSYFLFIYNNENIRNKIKAHKNVSGVRVYQQNDSHLYC